MTLSQGGSETRAAANLLLAEGPTAEVGDSFRS
jgi:hypothetical protein